MKHRPRFRPRVDDRLEDRVVLSHAATVSIAKAAVPTRTIKVGTLGDSLTDEYRSYSPDLTHARNWVEILAATRRVNFGTYSARSLREPRNSGFSANWARNGATTDDMVRTQLPGLTAQVKAGKVNTVAIFIGNNDFLQYLQKAASPLSNQGTDPATDLAKVEANAEANLTTAVQTVLLANPNAKVVLVTLPDVTTIPAIQGFSNYTGASTLFGTTSAAIAKYNAKMQAMASANGRISVDDLASQFAAINQNAAATGSITVGSTMIDLRTPGDDANHFYLADGVHPGTIGQAEIANGIIQAINAEAGTAIAPLSATDILKVARRLPPR